MSGVLLLGLFVAGLALVVVEMFVPGGLLGLLGAGLLAYALYETFLQYGAATGVVASLATALATTAVLWVGLRRMTVRERLDPERGYTVSRPEQERLLGHEGVTITPLRPSGLARIDGRRVDVVTRGEPLEAGTRVRVIDTSANRIVVRKV